MVLLRMAIGWHFFYEGVWKLVQPDWSAQHYLLASSGPFRPIFRMMVKDPDGVERLTLDSTQDRIDASFERIVNHYEFDDEQKKEAEAIKESAQATAEDMYKNDEDFKKQMEDYLILLDEIKTVENMNPKPEYKKERMYDMYARKNRTLKSVLGRADQPMTNMEQSLLAMRKDGQIYDKGDVPPPPSQTEWIDWANMIALTAVGVGLMLGLFTRLSALGGVGLLVMYYFAMPPWPGLPPNPEAEGHYLIVNKNLIEAFALLMIATSGIGRWAGLDAFFHRAKVKSAAVNAQHKETSA